jgi:hypothetical protein
MGLIDQLFGWLKRDSALERERPFRRKAVCASCGKNTLQTLHGYTPEGELWKGHECECKGWHCQSCGVVGDKLSMCCR